MLLFTVTNKFNMINGIEVLRNVTDIRVEGWGTSRNIYLLKPNGELDWPDKFEFIKISSKKRWFVEQGFVWDSPYKKMWDVHVDVFPFINIGIFPEYKI